MYRRTLLRSGLAASLGAVAGCLGGSEGGPPPPLDDRPVGVYRPTHAPRPVHVDTRRAGPYAVGVLYSLPTRFWIVEGQHAERRSVRADQDVHLMATVWDPETGTVLPDTGVTVELVGRGQDAREVVYPMVSQRMGFHYGDNFALDGPGDYAVTVDVAGTAIERTGAFDGQFGDPESATVEFSFEDELGDYARPADAGDPGAVEGDPGPVPAAGAPPVGALPGRHLGTETADGARYAAVALDPPPGLADGGGEGEDAPGESTYLAVSARTRHRGLVLPAAGLSGRIERGGRPVHEGPLGRALDPDLGYHYGALVPELRPGDRIEFRVTTPPQVARHEGYETAFTDTAAVSMTVE